eukprot:13824918-Ditylum_brightwellii.AAC.1
MYFTEPDHMCVWELSEKFFITYNAKIRYRKSIDSLDVTSRFKAVLRDDKNPSSGGEKVLRQKIGFNLGKSKEEDKTNQDKA